MSQQIIERESSKLIATNRELICMERSQDFTTRKQSNQILARLSPAWQMLADSRAFQIAVTICIALVSRYLIQFSLHKDLRIDENRLGVFEAFAGSWRVLVAVIAGAIVYRFVLTQLHLVYVRSELERRPRHEEFSIQGNIALSGYLAYLFFVYCENTWVSMGALVLLAAIYSMLRILDEPAMIRSHISQFRPFVFGEEDELIARENDINNSKAGLMLLIWGILNLGESPGVVLSAAFADLEGLNRAIIGLVFSRWIEQVCFVTNCLGLFAILVVAANLLQKSFPIFGRTITHAEVNLASGQRLERLRQLAAIAVINLVFVSFFGPNACRFWSAALALALFGILHLGTNQRKSEDFLNSLRQVG